MRFRIIPLEERIVLDAAGGLDIAHHSYAFEQASIEHALSKIGNQALEKAANIDKILPVRALTDSGKSAVLDAIKKQISQASNQSLNSLDNSDNSTTTNEISANDTTIDNTTTVRRIEETLPQVKALLDSVKGLMTSGEILNLTSRQLTPYPDGYLKSVIDNLIAQHNSNSANSNPTNSDINSILNNLTNSSNRLNSNSLDSIQQQLSQVSGLNNTSNSGTTDSGLSINGSLRSLTPLSESSLSRFIDSHKNLEDSHSDDASQLDSLFGHFGYNDNVKDIQTKDSHSDSNSNVDHRSVSHDRLSLALETLQNSFHSEKADLDYSELDYSKGEALATYFLNQYFNNTLGVNPDGSLSYI